MEAIMSLRYRRRSVPRHRKLDAELTLSFSVPRAHFTVRFRVRFYVLGSGFDQSCLEPPRELPPEPEHELRSENPEDGTV
jgi:hypothetical protein